jgi:hypothetical protein
VQTWLFFSSRLLYRAAGFGRCYASRTKVAKFKTREICGFRRSMSQINNGLPGRALQPYRFSNLRPSGFVEPWNPPSILVVLKPLAQSPAQFALHFFRIALPELTINAGGSVIGRLLVAQLASLPFRCLRSRAHDSALHTRAINPM